MTTEKKNLNHGKKVFVSRLNNYEEHFVFHLMLRDHNGSKKYTREFEDTDHLQEKCNNRSCIAVTTKSIHNRVGVKYS